MGIVRLGRLLLDALYAGGLRGVLAGLAVVTLTLVNIPLGGILVTSLGGRLLLLVGGAVAVGIGWVLIRRARGRVPVVRAPRLRCVALGMTVSTWPVQRANP